MRIRLDQSLPGSVAEVLEAFTDPVFLATLATLPKTGAPEVLEQRREGDLVHQRTRYRFRGDLSSAVRRVLDPERLTWVDERTYDLVAATATFRIVPDHYGRRLRCEGGERFTPDPPDHTHRLVEADLSVSWPIVGGAVERAIVSGLEEHLADEADLLRRWLGDETAGP